MSDSIGKIQTHAFTSYGNQVFDAAVQKQSVKTPDRTHKTSKHKPSQTVKSRPPACILVPVPPDDPPAPVKPSSASIAESIRLSYNRRLLEMESEIKSLKAEKKSLEAMGPPPPPSPRPKAKFRPVVPGDPPPPVEPYSVPNAESIRLSYNRQLSILDEKIKLREAEKKLLEAMGPPPPPMTAEEFKAQYPKPPKDK